MCTINPNPPSYAAKTGNAAIVRCFAVRGAPVNRYDRYARTPLSQAAQRGQRELERLLLEKGAIVNCTVRTVGIVPPGDPL